MYENDSIKEKKAEFIRKQIYMKNGFHPYEAVNTEKSIVTNIDSFPYTGFFTGVYNLSNPVVFEREAGWTCIKHSNVNKSNDNKSNDKSTYPNHCFEPPCSTVYPCYAKNPDKFSERNTQFNNACDTRYQ